MSVSDLVGEATSDVIGKVTLDTRKALRLDFKNSDTRTRRAALDQRVFDLERDISALKGYQNNFTPRLSSPSGNPSQHLPHSLILRKRRLGCAQA